MEVIMTEKEFYTMIGARLKGLREQARIKKVELEQKTGFAVSFLSSVENHGKKISAYQLARLCDAMGYTLDDVFGKKKAFANETSLRMRHSR
jgi:transcriptional regulator with XRE-family HTH domain